MSTKAKLSTLMSRGASKIPSVTSRHFTLQNGEVTGACAIGCMIYELGFVEQFMTHTGLWYLPARLHNILNIRLRGRDLPTDVRGFFRDDVSYVFYYIIAETNDKMSRERAIKLVKELGY